MMESEYCKFWKLDMLEESAEIYFKDKNRIIDDVPRPQIPDSTPEWLVKVMRKYNGYDPKLITKRTLRKTDLNSTQACLSMHASQLQNSDFLTEEETRIIEDHQLKIKPETLKVVLVDPKSKKHNVDLRKWDSNESWKYVINNGWNNVVAANTFEVNHVIQVWSFRYEGGRLCLALSPPTRSDSSPS